MTAPLLTIACCVTDFQLVSYTFDFHHPFIATYRGLDDLILLVIFWRLVALTKVCKVLYVIIVVGLIGHVSNVCPSIHILPHVIFILFHVLSVVFNCKLSKFEFVLERHRTQLVQDSADTIAITCLELIWRHV